VLAKGGAKLSLVFLSHVAMILIEVRGWLGYERSADFKKRRFAEDESAHNPAGAGRAAAT
jgi:hypothetical protein